MSHPEYVAVGTRLAIVVAPDDSWSVVEPLLIFSLDYQTPEMKNGSSGAR